MQKPEFIANTYSLLRFEILQGANEDMIFSYLIDFDQVRLFQDGESKAYGQNEYDRLLKLHKVPSEYQESKLEIRDVQKRLLDNYLYDQLNAGVNNFIYSSFQYMIGRQPTLSELNQGKLMCSLNNEPTSGQVPNLFFRHGTTRQDFLDILTSNDNYLEFQIAYWYERLLFQKPDIRTIDQLMKKVTSADQDRIIENIILQVLTYNEP